MNNQGYRFVGDHSAVKICRWTKKSIRDEGVCYKEKFYGIDSHRCCQMTPWLGCQNNCMHCWRAIELDFNKLIEGKKLQTPKEIVDGSILAQRKLIEGFKILPETKHKTHSRANMKKWEEAQEPNQFAISLSGEPTLYSLIGGLIEELRSRGKTTFLVTNGLFPKKLEELRDKNQLPTQLYISVNAPNRELYDKFHRSRVKDAWRVLNDSLKIMSTLKGKTRTVFRMNLVKDLNMGKDHLEQYAAMIKEYNPLIVEIKGYMSVGFARKRLGYDRMPREDDMLNFAKQLAEKTGLKVLDFHERSRAVVLGNNKDDLKIKKTQI